MSLAKSIVDDCLQITEKDNVTINLYPHELPLAEDIAVECFRKGADAMMSLFTDRFLTSYYDLLSEESLRKPSAYCRSFSETSTAEVFLAATYDPSVLRTIDPKKQAADSEGETKAHFPLMKERRVRTLNVGLALVTKPRARTYGFNYEKWNRMMEAATSVDYGKLSKVGRALREKVRSAQHFTITGPGQTDLSFDVAGRKWYLSDGVVDQEDIENEDLDDQLPAGALTVAPLEDSAKGRITFNAGTPFMGRLPKGLQLTFEKGRVVSFRGNASTAALKKRWESGTGDKEKIGYFGIGFNPKAETGYTVNNVAYGAVSIGIGGNEFLRGKNRPGFTYIDSIVGATVKADGETILQKGKLVSG
ncbi:MAG TPA: aminopeptidase [Nitrososphaerales archaeon]|nr:aminopeptidase [Nitrososphaerales archaeon]